MITANLDFPNGTKVKIEGTPEEVNKILAIYNTSPINPVLERKVNIHSVQKRRARGGGAMQQLRDSLNEGFFNKQRTISDVKHKLEELGHIYPLNQLSTPLRRLVNNRELRRMKEGKNWVYVQV